MDGLEDAINRISDKINGQRDNGFLVSMDNFFRYFRTIQNKPVPIQISVGAVGGFATGYFMTRISKFFAAVAGVSLIIVQFLNYRGYIKFRRNQLRRDIDYLTDQIKVPNDSIPTSRDVEGFLSKNVYLLGGFVAGSMIGFSLA